MGWVFRRNLSPWARALGWLGLCALIALAPLEAALAAPGAPAVAPATAGAEPPLELFLPLVARQPVPPPPCGPPPIPPDDLANEQAILSGLNDQRAANSLAALAVVEELTQAARRHSRDMADNNFTGHTGSDGSDGGQRMQEACYDWTTWAEIIGWGFGGDPDAMIDWWMSSQTHHDIILSTKYEDFGAGYAFNSGSDYEHYWTVNFGKRAAPGSAPAQRMYACVYLSSGMLGGSMLMVYSDEPCRD